MPVVVDPDLPDDVLIRMESDRGVVQLETDGTLRVVTFTPEQVEAMRQRVIRRVEQRLARALGWDRRPSEGEV